MNLVSSPLQQKRDPRSWSGAQGAPAELPGAHRATQQNSRESPRKDFDQNNGNHQTCEKVVLAKAQQNGPMRSAAWTQTAPPRAQKEPCQTPNTRVASLQASPERGQRQRSLLSTGTTTRLAFDTIPQKDRYSLL